MPSQEIAEKKWDGDGCPLEDSNVAGIGSDEDKELRKNAALTEPAWEGIGLEAGLWIFRVENFEVVPWPKEFYGNFHTKDSYIILSVEAGDEDDEPLDRQIYFWIGKETGIDERGVAAYKTVELDDLFGGSCGQNREVERKESEDFLELFPKIQHLKGGIESGFNPVSPEVFMNRLMDVRRTKKRVIVSDEVVMSSDSLNHRDAFILDAGLKIWVFYGDDCNPFVKQACITRAKNLESERTGCYEVFTEPDEEFWEIIGGKGDICPSDAVEEDEDPDFGHGSLYSVKVGEDRQLEIVEAGRNELDRDMLDTTAVMMLDTRTEIFLWIGKESCDLTRRNALRTATQYLKTNGRDPDDTAIHMFKEGAGQKNKVWKTIFPKKKH